MPAPTLEAKPATSTPEKFQVQPVPGSFNPETRTARFSVLDDSWITRFDWNTWEFYDLQFKIDDSAIDRSRIDAGTALFTDEHRDDRRIGKITECDIEDGKVYFTVLVGTSEWGQRYAQECADGVEPGKSIEVFINEVEEIEPAEYEGEGWGRRQTKRAKKIATSYEFSGVSTVSCPAVGTVGFSADDLVRLGATRQLFSEQASAIALLQQSFTSLKERLSMTTPVPIVDLTQDLPPINPPAATPNNQSEIEALKAQLSQYQEELAAQKASRRKEGIEAFLSVHRNSITPAMQQFSAKVTFGDGDRQMTMNEWMNALSDPMLEWFMAWTQQTFVQQVPSAQSIPPGEFGGNNAPLSPQGIAAEAQKLMAEAASKGQRLSHSDAVNKVISMHGVAN